MIEGVYGQIYDHADIQDGVRMITYDQFTRLRNSGEKYLLLDVLLADTYNQGHIEGAINLPVTAINAETAAGVASKDSNIVVYCGSFKCTASTTAAQKLSALGYKVVDYKGGLKEWKEKGNQLVS